MPGAYSLIFDGFADWELGRVLPGLRHYGKVDVVTVGFSPREVVSMGGLRVIPDTVISEVRPEDMLLFILPGGYLWEGDYPRAEVEPLLGRLEEAKIPMAAICGSTIVVARAGLLEHRKHTSNSKAYLAKMVPDYAGSEHYVEALATRDNHLITASGLGCVEFAMEIFSELEVVSSEMRAVWYEAFKYGRFSEPA